MGRQRLRTGQCSPPQPTRVATYHTLVRCQPGKGRSTAITKGDHCGQVADPPATTPSGPRAEWTRAVTPGGSQQRPAVVEFREVLRYGLLRSRFFAVRHHRDSSPTHRRRPRPLPHTGPRLKRPNARHAEDVPGFRAVSAVRTVPLPDLWASTAPTPTATTRRTPRRLSRELCRPAGLGEARRTEPVAPQGPRWRVKVCETCRGSPDLVPR